MTKTIQSLRTEFKEENRSIELDSGYVKMKLKMIPYMYTVKMKLKTQWLKKKTIRQVFQKE